MEEQLRHLNVALRELNQKLDKSIEIAEITKERLDKLFEESENEEYIRHQTLEEELKIK